MSDNYVQSAEGSGTTTAVGTLNSVVAGNTIVAFFFSGTGGASLLSLSSSNGGALTAVGTLQTEAINGVSGRGYVLENANSGTHVITGTVDIGASAYVRVVEVGSTAGTDAFLDADGNVQASPGTGANAVLTPTLTIAAAATVVAFSCDDAVVNDANCPAVGTGFADKAHASNAVIGSWRLESKAAAADSTATFTAITGTDPHVTLAIAILNAVAAAEVYPAVNPAAGGMTSAVSRSSSW